MIYDDYDGIMISKVMAVGDFKFKGLHIFNDNNSYSM